MQVRACILIAITLLPLVSCELTFQTGERTEPSHLSAAENLGKFLVESLQAVQRDRRSDEEDDEDSDDISDNRRSMKGESIFNLPNNSLISNTNVFSSNWGDVIVECGKLKKHYAMVITVKSTIQHPAQLYSLAQTIMNANNLNGNNNNNNSNNNNGNIRS